MGANQNAVLEFGSKGGYDVGKPQFFAITRVVEVLETNLVGREPQRIRNKPQAGLVAPGVWITGAELGLFYEIGEGIISLKGWDGFSV